MDLHAPRVHQSAGGVHDGCMHRGGCRADLESRLPAQVAVLVRVEGAQVVGRVLQGWRAKGQSDYRSVG